MTNEKIGHLTKKKIGHLSNCKIPQMPDASGGFLLYTKQDDATPPRTAKARAIAEAVGSIPLLAGGGGGSLAWTVPTSPLADRRHVILFRSLMIPLNERGMVICKHHLRLNEMIATAGSASVGGRHAVGMENARTSERVWPRILHQAVNLGRTESVMRGEDWAPKEVMCRG